MKYNCFLIFLFVLASAFVGCSGTGDPPRWDLCHTTKKDVTATQAIATTDDLVVYLDTSGSMAGYISPNEKAAFSVSPDGSTIFSKTLLELRNVVTTMSPQPQIAIRTVDTNISRPSFSDLELSQASRNRGIFSGKETNLAGAIKTFPEPLDKDAVIPAPPRFHILVTDGVQSSGKNNSNLSCAQGSDSLCVKKHLLALMNNGWGGAIIGMRSEFNGNVYSEILNGKPVPYNTGKDPNKFRPFYLYVFSPDRAALDKLVDSLRQRLSTLGGPDAFREFGLTTDYSTGIANVEIAQDKATKELLEVRQEKGKGDEVPRITVKSSLDTETKGKQQFTLSIKPTWSNHALAGGSPDELAGMIKWTLKPVYPEKEKGGSRYPDFRIAKQEVKNGNSDLTLETGWLRAPGDADWRMFQLIGTLDVERPAPAWVSSWTTNLDTSVDTASKTLNLESSVANLWRNSVLDGYPIAEVCVRVGKK